MVLQGLYYPYIVEDWLLFVVVKRLVSSRSVGFDF